MTFKSSSYKRSSPTASGRSCAINRSKKTVAKFKSLALRISSCFLFALVYLIHPNEFVFGSAIGVDGTEDSSKTIPPFNDNDDEGRIHVQLANQEILTPEDDQHEQHSDHAMAVMNENSGGDDGDDDSTSMANNLFEWHMTNHTSRFHIGCEKLLKENHDPEPLAPINFGGTKSSEGINEDGEMAMASTASANQAINCINNLADTGTGTKYACSNINLMSFFNLATFKSPNKCNGIIPEGNDVWGWSYNGREFALMGLSNGAGFVEVTDPVNPVYIGILLSHTGCTLWRNIKTYADHAFVVSEASGHGMQVFDLTKLLTADPTKMPIEFSETAHYSGFSNAHTLDIDVVAGFAYAMGTNTYSRGLHIVNIQNPTSPVLAGGFSQDGYIHDGQCITYNGPDTRYINSQICFCYCEDSLTIVDVSDKLNTAQLSRLTYANSGYTHQGWLTDDGKHVIVDDEYDQQTKTRTHVFNVESLTNPFYVGYHSGTTSASDHNLYIKGNLVFESNYQAGLQVLRIDNLATPKLTQVAHFDIYTSNDSAGYHGSWSNYPYFASGTVLVSGIEQGLYVLQSANNFGEGSSPPSSSPSSSPTTFTSAPSSAPTTKSPTSKPTTKFPSFKPSTKSPTIKPTTISPTTKYPTRKPTKKPVTRRPTRQPTSRPVSTRRQPDIFKY